MRVSSVPYASLLTLVYNTPYNNHPREPYKLRNHKLYMYVYVLPLLSVLIFCAVVLIVDFKTL